MGTVGRPGGDAGGVIGEARWPTGNDGDVPDAPGCLWMMRRRPEESLLEQMRCRNNPAVLSNEMG